MLVFLLVLLFPSFLIDCLFSILFGGRAMFYLHCSTDCQHQSGFSHLLTGSPKTGDPNLCSCSRAKLSEALGKLSGKPSTAITQALLRLMFGVEGFTMNMEHAVLRAMDSTPELCSEMPLWGSAETRKTWQVWCRAEQGGIANQFEHQICGKQTAESLGFACFYHRYRLVSL